MHNDIWWYAIPVKSCLVSDPPFLQNVGQFKGGEDLEENIYITRVLKITKTESLSNYLLIFFFLVRLTFRGDLHQLDTWESKSHSTR